MLNFKSHWKSHSDNFTLDRMIQLRIPFDSINRNSFLTCNRKDFHALQHTPSQTGELTDNNSVSFLQTLKNTRFFARRTDRLYVIQLEWILWGGSASETVWRGLYYGNARHSQHVSQTSYYWQGNVDWFWTNRSGKAVFKNQMPCSNDSLWWRLGGASLIYEYSQNVLQYLGKESRVHLMAGATPGFWGYIDQVSEQLIKWFMKYLGKNEQNFDNG